MRHIASDDCTSSSVMRREGGRGAAKSQSEKVETGTETEAETRARGRPKLRVSRTPPPCVLLYFLISIARWLSVLVMPSSRWSVRAGS